MREWAATLRATVGVAGANNPTRRPPARGVYAGFRFYFADQHIGDTVKTPDRGRATAWAPCDLETPAHPQPAAEEAACSAIKGNHFLHLFGVFFIQTASKFCVVSMGNWGQGARVTNISTRAPGPSRAPHSPLNQS